MPIANYKFFSTSIGRCAVAWIDDAVVAVALPERHDAGTRRRLVDQCGVGLTEVSAVPNSIQLAIEAMVSLLEGESVDLGFIDIDLHDQPVFSQAVYALTRTIPPGSTLTYGAVAKRIGEPGAAQAVGQALGANPIPIIVPCHRVLGAGGKLVGFSANGGTETKRRMLLIEGAPEIQPSLFDMLADRGHNDRPAS